MSWRQSQYSSWVIVEAEQGPAIYDPYDYAKRAKTYMGGLLVRERNT
ncbi:hypothetical protein ACWNPK_06250 [Bacillus atrophaeus]